METKIINSICTGVPGLDDFLIWPKPLDKITKNDEKKKNGLPLGRIILLTGKAGTGKTMFAIQVAMQFLADNQQQDQAEVAFSAIQMSLYIIFVKMLIAVVIPKPWLKDSIDLEW